MITANGLKKNLDASNISSEKGGHYGKGDGGMTITLTVEKRPEMEVTLEWDKSGVFHARVYEKWGGEWHQTHESRPYPADAEDKAIAAHKRFIKKYIK